MSLSRSSAWRKLFHLRNINFETSLREILDFQKIIGYCSIYFEKRQRVFLRAKCIDSLHVHISENLYKIYDGN